MSERRPTAQRPLELILARNLLSSISTPAFLIGEGGTLLFFNEAAGAMLGRRFEDTDTLAADDWTSEFGPVDSSGDTIPYEEIPATTIVRDSRPFHGRFAVKVSGKVKDVAASAIPIVGPGGSAGAIVFFWPVDSGGTSPAPTAGAADTTTATTATAADTAPTTNGRAAAR